MRPVLITEANELYDMGIIDLHKLIEWPFYSLTFYDSLALNQAKARIKERSAEDVDSPKSRAALIDVITHTMEV